MTTTAYRRSYVTTFGVEMRCISWAEYERITGRPRPEAANDNNPGKPTRRYTKPVIAS